MKSWTKMPLPFALLMGLSIYGQRPSSSASGPCSVAITGTSNKATITCGNLTPEEAKKLVDVLNQIQQSNVNLDQLIARLNELLGYVKEKVDPNQTTFTYDFNGTQRSNSPGVIGMNRDLSVQAFQPMLRLASIGSWAELESFSKSQTVAHPGWFTPELFSGLAELHLCKSSEGTRDVDDYLQRVSTYPAYQTFSAKVSQWILDAKKDAESCPK